jgi:hypothetical protein
MRAGRRRRTLQAQRRLLVEAHGSGPDSPCPCAGMASAASHAEASAKSPASVHRAYGRRRNVADLAQCYVLCRAGLLRFVTRRRLARTSHRNPEGIRMRHGHHVL